MQQSRIEATNNVLPKIFYYILHKKYQIWFLTLHKEKFMFPFRRFSNI